MWICRSGFAKSDVRLAAWAEAGDRARRFVGRRERRSKEVGIDSGIGSDMAIGLCVFVCISVKECGEENRETKRLERRLKRMRTRVGRS